MNARVEFLNLRFYSVKGGLGGDAVEDDLMPDFIFSEASGSGDSGSDCFLNGRSVVFENRGSWCIILGDEEDMMVGCELNCSNKRFLNCCVEVIADGEGVSVIW